MPSFIVLLELGCSKSQVASTGPGVAEAAGAQKDAVQACQVFNLPAPNRLSRGMKEAGLKERGREGRGGGGGRGEKEWWAGMGSRMGKKGGDGMSRRFKYNTYTEQEWGWGRGGLCYNTTPDAVCYTGRAEQGRDGKEARAGDRESLVGNGGWGEGKG